MCRACSPDMRSFAAVCALTLLVGACSSTDGPATVTGDASLDSPDDGSPPSLCHAADPAIACAALPNGPGCLGRDLGYADDHVYPQGCTVRTAREDYFLRCPTGLACLCDTAPALDGGTTLEWVCPL
jgi:hypothetical protein